MGMVGGSRVGPARNRACRACVGMIGAALAGLFVAGCSTAPQGPMQASMQGPVQGPMAAATVQGPTIAFESIDGPPESIFRTFVQDLNDEAAGRQMAVVSRAAPAQYRVRGYLAALVGKRRATVITWVWDVYGADQNRIVRITGEEPASASGRGTWAAADERVLRRIAKSGMDQLAAFLTAPNSLPVPPALPAEGGPNVASTEGAPPGAALAFLGGGR